MNNTNNEQDHVDEDSGILVEEFLRIHDPETDEVYYEGRT
jgi:hypothetical protein